MKKPVKLELEPSNRQLLDDKFETHLLSEINTIDATSVAYWLIEEEDDEAIKRLVEAIRRHPAPAIYLRAIVLLTKNNAKKTNTIDHGADALYKISTFDQATADTLSSDFEGVNQWIERIPNLSDHSDINTSLKVLRFISSRDTELLPVMTTQVHNGYDYPSISAMFEKDDDAVIDTLSFLQKQRLLSPRFITKTHLCSHCNGAFLNFKEVCPDCASEEINPDELIHHFKCAYTGEFSEFVFGDELICPKCDKRLHHIGVDYDKPSIIFRCSQCNHSFQEPEINSTCFSCGRSSKPEDQVLQIINGYSATSIGHNAAIYGLESLFSNILETELNLFTHSAFKDFIKIEISRTTRYKITNSTFVILQFSDLENLYIRLGKRAEEVFSELSAIFKSILRQSDIISARNESIFFIILTETDTAQAKQAIDRLTSGITQLLENNLDYSPEVLTRIEKIDAQLEIDNSLERLLENNVH
ncbi:MAG: hypothetical protein DRR42_14755 [Gammaproteobacteria bacterium]|nr:MAG: hypothetical protein DRR42_14755 [Gammaproteobacteria bacterium]